jgi:two-component system, NtrC family, sensor kinase
VLIVEQERSAAARQAGMAEIATNVLHNVGNILNSVNVSAELVDGTLRRSKAQGLVRAVELIEAQGAGLGRFLQDDERGRLLPGYLRGLADALTEEQQRMLKELQHLGRSVQHIKDVVSTQQSYAVAASFTEPARATELADEALRLDGRELDRAGIHVERDYAEVPQARFDRGRVLQILVNLVSNARHAMAEVPPPQRKLVVRVTAEAGRVRIAVRDFGEGIAPENLTRIFVHGFTTRRSGHGFGLHSSAVAAREMGGTLAAHSDGPGRGATFTLELPLEAAKESA